MFKLRNIFFDNFDYQKLWKTIALMICFNSFNFSRQIYRIFIVSISSLIWLKKIPVLLFISSLLMLIDSFKKFWRSVKRNLLKVVIVLSPVYLIVLMLISYNHFMILIALTLYVLLMFPFPLIAISMVLQWIFLVKISILVFAIAADCLMMSGNIKKLTCWNQR